MNVIEIPVLDWPGTTAELRARVDALRQAKKDHAQTVNVPAPRDEPAVEAVFEALERGLIDDFYCHDERDAKNQEKITATLGAMTVQQKRIAEYHKQGVLGDAATMTLLSGDAAAIAALRAKKAAIDASIT